jgi:hypothetical protein
MFAYRAPPRPSPGSILYDDVEMHQAMTSFRDDDSGHASDRACQVSKTLIQELHLLLCHCC